MKTRVFAVCMVVFLFCGITHAGLSDGLVAYYPFNGNANDESGNSHNGTESGGVTYGEGVIGRAANFDGKDDRIKVSNLNLEFTDFTVSFWIFPLSLWDFADPIEADTWSSFVFHSTHDGSVFVGVVGDDGDRLTPDEIPSNTVVVNQWQIFTFIIENRIGKFYKNGKLIATKRQAAPKKWTVFKLGDDTSNVIHGSIDDLRIYNRALSETEIQQLYQGQGACSSEVVRFTAGTPAKAADVNANFDALKCQNQALNSQLQALKAIVCKNEPTASVCQ
jgi:hypothetical protein